MTPTPPATTISATPPPGATPPASGAPAGSPQAGAVPSAADLAALKQQLDDLKLSSAEQARAIQFWHDQALKGGKPDKPPKEEEPEQDLLELITTKGEKGLDAWNKKRGYIRGEEVDEKINRRVSQVQKETELVERYPDLKNQKGEFFQATAQHYGNLKKEGVPESVAMEMAADRTYLEFLQSGKAKTPQQQADEKKAQKEADRLARISAQSGERGSRHQEASEDDDELSENDKTAIRHMCDALDISIEEGTKRYIARAKAGVNVMPKLGRGGR
ncbi:MAG TPA: hypothetical protein VN776_11405 [Terracidiphilus sp.]|nr:hypothetical protein [Terracidiphilus sp.]